MEDYQEQEYEFLRRLEEERVGRRTLLKRGLVAGAGLTVLSLSPAALAARKKALADPPVVGRLAKLSDIVAAAKKEGKLNTIALPPDWSNYGEVMSTFQKKYGISITNTNPNGSSSEENAAIVSLKGDPRAPDVVDVNPTFAVNGATQGLYGKYYTTNFRKVPRAMKDGRGFWVGDYWGAISIGASKSIVGTVPKTFADLLKPEYKGKVALNGSPLTSGSGRGGVFAAAIANGGSLSNVAPGIDWFAKLKSVGNWVPVPATPQTVASGQTPIVIDWDYLNLAYTKEFPSVQWVTTIPADGVYGGSLRPGCQRHCSAPLGGTAVAGVPLLGPGSVALPEGVRAPGPLHRHGGPQGHSERHDQGAAGGEPLLEGEVRERQAGPRRTDLDQGAVARKGRGLGSEHRSRSIRRRASAGLRARPTPEAFTRVARRSPVLRVHGLLPLPPVGAGDDRRLQR